MPYIAAAATLEIIAQRKGKYLVGLKANEKQMKKQVSWTSEKEPFLAKFGTAEKGHGRIEFRDYEFYDLVEMSKDARWNACQIKTAIKVGRARIELKNGKKSQEESYYVTNMVGNARRTSRSYQKTLASRNQ